MVTALSDSLTETANPAAAASPWGQCDVDTGVGVIGKENDDELTVVPNFFEKLAPWLSSSDGSATLGARFFYVVLVLYPLCDALLGVSPISSGSVVEQLEADNIEGAVTLLLLSVAHMACGYGFHTLRLSTRSGGSLEQLGVGTIRVSPVRVRQIRRTNRRIRALVAFAVTIIVLSNMVKLVSGSYSPLKILLYTLWNVPYNAALCSWWLTLSVATAMVSERIDTQILLLRAEAARLRDTVGATFDRERWRTEVEQPVQQLAYTVMPIFSKGWGTSVAACGGGMVLWSMAVLLSSRHHLMNPTESLPVRIVYLAITPLGSALPFFFVSNPAGASSACKRLENEINACGLLLTSDTEGFARVDALVRSLKRLNKDQGLGFTVFGQCVSKRTLWLIGSSLYSVVAVAGPAILGNIGLSSSGCNNNAGGQLAHCPFGWEFADDSCFRLFGAQPSNQAPIDGEQMVTSDFEADASLTWADAELACAALGVGIHLATLASKEHQRIATELSAGQENVWIGFSDLEATDNWGWVDETPPEFVNWLPQHPDRTAGGGEVAALYGLDLDRRYRWIDLHADERHPYLCGMRAIPLVASGGHMLGCEQGQWVLGTPFSSTRAGLTLPKTIVYGVFPAHVYQTIVPQRVEINGTIGTAAECMTHVRMTFPDANAAEFSNVPDKQVCHAVFGADGVIHDPVSQTCMFELG